VEIGESRLKASVSKAGMKNLKKQTKTKTTWGVAQVVEYLHEDLSSIPRTARE
jgi:hypothetical protein